PGTLAAMPSLVGNTPYAEAECLEHGVPFVTTRFGGIAELVVEEDQERVLCLPTADDLADALTRALASRPGFAAARPDRPGAASLDGWLGLLDGLTPWRPPRTPPAKRVAVIAHG